MEIVEVKNILKLLIGARYVGHGSMAVCFLLSNGNVLKIFLNTYNKKRLFSNKDLLEQIQKINEIKNSSYIVPVKAYIYNGELIAYEAPYVSGKVLSKCPKTVTIDKIVQTISILDRDTLDISQSQFVLADLHGQNIMYDGGIKVIDLDVGSFNANPWELDKLHNYNMKNLIAVIIKTLFKYRGNDYIYFADSKLNALYCKMYREDYQYYKEFFERLKKELNGDETQVLDLRLQRKWMVSNYPKYKR